MRKEADVSAQSRLSKQTLLELGPELKASPRSELGAV